jgi:hypothetical protein
VSKYRKKPVVIEAVQWTGDNFADVGTFCPIAIGPIVRMEPTDALGSCNRLRISTLEGDMYADAGDWIIRGVKGEFYPCKPGIFAATYEAVDSPSGAAQEGREE